MNDWIFTYNGFEPEEEGLREALCTLGNGYIATRGAAAEVTADQTHYPGTYLAGGYDRLTTKIADRNVENEDLVNLPNWLPLTFRIEGEPWFDLSLVEILSYKQQLDLKKGMLVRTLCFQGEKGRVTTMVNRRIVHMALPHLAAIQTKIIAENWSGNVEILSAIDGRVINAGVERYKALNSRHIEVKSATRVGDDISVLEVETVQSKLRIIEAARTRAYEEGTLLQPNKEIIQERGYIASTFTIKVEQETEYLLEKVVSIYTSKDKGISECSLQAKNTLSQAGSFDQLCESHQCVWKNVWRDFEINYEPKSGKQNVGTVVHLYMFHVLQTLSRHTADLDVGVPARGLHGEAYRGHIFWDELFVFPLLNFHMPVITKSLLLYRYRRLPAARVAAREKGFTGAMFPWQSGSSGREETQQVHLNPKSGRWISDNSLLQRHVNHAIAYNVWQYFQVTGDKEFLCLYGAEMVLDIARFLASLATYNEQKRKYEILHVMGPDEYHDALPGADEPGLPNNAYTNIMTVWVLRCSLELLDILGESDSGRICGLIGLTEQEKNHWKDICSNMTIPFHDGTIISQFEGYDQLEEFDWETYRKKYGDIHRLDRILEAEGDTANRYKVSKQADVLMLFYLFSAEELQELFEIMGYAFDPQMIRKNIAYYMERTSHGSTLSVIVHSWVFSRFDKALSWKFFEQALESDVVDIQGGTTQEGIHLGAMAGVIDILQRGYMGLKVRGDCLYLDPIIPEGLEKFHTTIRFRGKRLKVELTPTSLRVMAEETSTIAYGTEVVQLDRGREHEFEIRSE